MVGFCHHDITGVHGENTFCRGVESGAGVQGVRVMGEGKVEAVITMNARTIITDLKRHFQLPINRREREECVKDLRRKMIGLNI